MAGKFKLMDWSSVTGWVGQGGAYLGTKRAPPKEEQLPQIAQRLKEYGIQALLIIGGFEVFIVGDMSVRCAHRCRSNIAVSPLKGLSNGTYIFQCEERVRGISYSNCHDSGNHQQQCSRDRVFLRL